jgi:proline dehydrogenase
MARLDRWLLYRVATNDRFDSLVHRAGWLEDLAYRRAQRYVAGASLDDAVRTVQDLTADGLAASVDFFGESLSDPERIQGVVGDYLELIHAIEALDADAYVEVVPSHLGIDVSVEFFCEQAERIADALTGGARLEVSAEESWRTERIIEADLLLASRNVPIVATLQANLRRTAQDAARLADAGIPVRLVKGAYLEAPEVAHRWGEETDLAFVRLAHRLHAQGIDLALATHDPIIREALLIGLERVRVEMLLGVRADDARDLVRRGHHVRVYVPYGSEWFRYWMRRIAEARGA